MEKDQELRFVCKWCDKKYPCGKSLGGHMRSHVIAAANSAESDEKLSALMAETGLIKCEAPSVAAVAGAGGGGINGEFGGPSGGYGLRENPKKTWRAVGSTFPIQQQERICKQCGKGFQSLKALCGHMACHSEKERVLKDDHSWTSEDPKLVMDGHSDTEEAEDLRRQTRSKSKRYKRIVVKSSHFNLVNNNSINYGSSSVSEVYEQEQEEVAICLMMLSRDSGNWGGVNSVVESSDNNSVILETKSSSIDMKLGRKGGLSLGHEALEMKKLGGARKLKLSALDAESVQLENSHSGYFRNGVKMVDSDISVDELFRYGEYRKSLKGHEGVEISNADMDMGFNRGKNYETGLSKSFGKEKGFSEFGSSSKSLKYDLKRTRDAPESPELRKESLRRLIYEDSSDGELSKNVYKRSKYECLNCNKTFNSHQALGGHRPCHKKPTAKFGSRYASGENNLDDDDNPPDMTPTRKYESVSNKKQYASNAAKKIRTKKNKGHECPICFRMFKSGQALGGHKRSHFINGAEDFSNQVPLFKQDAAEIHDMIDLNLPAPEEDEADENEKFIY
ncbi:hypothetical protein ACET3Z_031869 [Daucus carota]